MADVFDSHNRRDFLRKSAAASTALAAMTVPRFAHAGSDETLKVGLIGCGNRGSGAAVDALSADPYAQLFAVGDAFEEQARGALDTIKRNSPAVDRVVVDNERVFFRIRRL